MIDGSKISPRLIALGYYTSPVGGSRSPFNIPAGQILFECITEGAVLDPIQGNLCEAGWIFVHHEGESTVSISPADKRYECLTASFDVSTSEVSPWPKRFYWENTRNRNTFCHEVLHSFHHAEMDITILGNMVWSQLRYRLECFHQESSALNIPPRIKHIMKYIELHHAQDLSIQDLADEADISASHLHAEFRQWTGLTPHQFLISHRMREARHRLVTTTDPIKAIADQVGYANTENFCRAFKKQFNSTAARYRRNYTIYP